MKTEKRKRVIRIGIIIAILLCIAFWKPIARFLFTYTVCQIGRCTDLGEEKVYPIGDSLK